MSQHSHCHTIYYVGKFIKKRHVAKPWPSFVVDTYVREKNPFLETFLWHYLNQSFSKTFSEFCVCITKRKSERNHWMRALSLRKSLCSSTTLSESLGSSTIWYRKRNLSYYSFSILALFFFYSFAS